VIKRNHLDGKDSHVRGIKVYGPRGTTDPAVLKDSSAKKGRPKSSEKGKMKMEFTLR